ncbi:hypothetical protein ACLOJK_027199 [Asimina triloba]
MGAVWWAHVMVVGVMERDGARGRLGGSELAGSGGAAEGRGRGRGTRASDRSNSLTKFIRIQLGLAKKRIPGLPPPAPKTHSTPPPSLAMMALPSRPPLSVWVLCGGVLEASHGGADGRLAHVMVVGVMERDGARGRLGGSELPGSGGAAEGRGRGRGTRASDRRLGVTDGWCWRCCGSSAGGDRSKEADGGGDVGRQDRSWLQEGTMSSAGAGSWSAMELLEGMERRR